MTPLIQYPARPITPAGQCMISKGHVPDVVLKAWDGSIEFDLMGGYSIPDKVMAPESVQITSIDGLIPPWKHIDQKGATQDGITNIDALLDPIEVNVDMVARGRDGPHVRRVTRDLIASIDAIRTSELGFFTRENGYWWADIRWFQGAPQMPLNVAPQRQQKVPLRLRADTGLWRTYAQIFTMTSGGWVPFVNVGDQPMYWDAVCYGPGTFYFFDGPNTTNTIAFGPLTTNQIALVRTDPRKRGVHDLTVTPPPQQAYNQYQDALSRFLSQASAGLLDPLLAAISSAFNVVPPQGPLYSLLQGRFSDAAAIDPRSPGEAPHPIGIGFDIHNGGAGSKAIFCGIPQRRYPL